MDESAALEMRLGRNLHRGSNPLPSAFLRGKKCGIPVRVSGVQNPTPPPDVQFRTKKTDEFDNKKTQRLDSGGTIIVNSSVYSFIYCDTRSFLFLNRMRMKGTGAHLFQLWIVLEVFAVSFFAIKWLPQRPKQALFVLALQVLAAFFPLAIVFFLKL